MEARERATLTLKQLSDVVISIACHFGQRSSVPRRKTSPRVPTAKASKGAHNASPDTLRSCIVSPDALLPTADDVVISWRDGGRFSTIDRVAIYIYTVTAFQDRGVIYPSDASTGIPLHKVTLTLLSAAAA